MQLSRGKRITTEVNSVTVTRKQGEMNENSLVHRSNGQSITHAPSSMPSLRWLELVGQIAQDKRHDLASGTLRFWKLKLAKYSDDIICQALAEGIWQFFPSVDNVIQQIEAILRRDREDACNKAWDDWKAEQERAKRDGLLATEEQLAEVREGLKKLAESKAMPQVKRETVYIPTTKELADQLSQRREALAKAGVE